MRQTEGNSLSALLRRRAKIGLAFESDSRGGVRQRRSRHPKNICVETMRVKDIDLVFDQVPAQPVCLLHEIRVVEAGQRILDDFRQSEFVSLRAQRTLVLQAR